MFRNGDDVSTVRCWSEFRLLDNKLGIQLKRNPQIMGWTRWRKLADQHYWYPETLSWDGPACYELAIAGPRGGGLRIMYIGETDNERRRLSVYARTGSHLSRVITAHLEAGFCLYYRAQAMPTKNAAFQMQNRMLRRFEYRWNKQLNHPG